MSLDELQDIEERKCGRFLGHQEVVHALCLRYGSLAAAFEELHRTPEFRGLGIGIAELRRVLEMLLSTDTEPVIVSLDAVRSIFRQLDVSHDGFIDEKEVHKADSQLLENVARQALHVAPKVKDAVVDKQILQRLDRKAPTEEALKNVLSLLWRSSHQDRERLLRFQIAQSASPDDRERLRKQLEGLNKSTESQEEPDSFWSVDVFDSNKVTLLEFQAAIWKAAPKDPDFSDHRRRFGRDVALRLALKGWTIKALFLELDTNRDGNISLKEWRRVNSRSKA